MNISYQLFIIRSHRKQCYCIYCNSLDVNTVEAFRLSLLTRLSKVHVNFSNLQVIIMIIPEEYFKLQDIYLQNS